MRGGAIFLRAIGVQNIQKGQTILASQHGTTIRRILLEFETVPYSQEAQLAIFDMRKRYATKQQLVSDERLISGLAISVLRGQDSTGTPSVVE